MSAEKVVSLGCGSGFWGDALDPAMELARSGRVQYLCFDFLAELTMALLQRSRAKNDSAGFVPDMVEWFNEMAAPARDAGTRLICNGGGVNPRSGAEALATALRAQGLKGTSIGVLSGDDMLQRLDEFIDMGLPLINSETGADDFKAIRGKVLSANVYLGSEGIVQALAGGADIVITGRVTDSALFIGPAMHELGWRYGDVDLVASAITVGHILECAAGCTGGMSSRFEEMPHMGCVGFPIVDLKDDGTATITKLPGTGGRVDEFTVKEHLVYEIGDPRSYITPDGIADFTSPRISEVAPDVVSVRGMKGRPRPPSLKMLVGYADGWIGEGLLMFPWPRALARARKAEQTLRERLERMGLEASALEFNYLGINMLHGPAAPPPAGDDFNEIGLRVAVKTASRDEADKVRRACSHLWIAGPGGTCFGVPMRPRPAVALWPTLIPRELVSASVESIVA